MARQRIERDRAATPRTFWVDPRFVIGVGLVLASVAGVFFFFFFFFFFFLHDALPIYYRGIITLTAAELTSQRVRLGDSASRYLTPERLPEEGIVVAHSVAAGELIPVSAVGNSAGVRMASVVVTVGGELAQSIAPGALVDIWASRESEQDGYGPPVVVVGGATVVRVLDASGLIAQRGQSVEVLVPRSAIARMLEAVANGDEIALVPLSLPLGR